jgi:hypothetical protein
MTRMTSRCFLTYRRIRKVTLLFSPPGAQQSAQAEQYRKFEATDLRLDRTVTTRWLIDRMHNAYLRLPLPLPHADAGPPGFGLHDRKNGQ